MEPARRREHVDESEGADVSGFQANIRAAAGQLLRDYIASAGVKMTVYDARPKVVQPAHAFVDTIAERIAYLGPTSRQRTPVVEVVVVHKIFDGLEAATQKDEFVDGFLDWCLTRYHAAGANTTLAVTVTEDIPNYAPDWYQTADVFYATRITLEGLGG